MARYPNRSYTHQYGNLTVTVKSKKGVYVVSVHRSSDGYDVEIETPAQTPMGAARYVLLSLSHAAERWAWDPNPVLLRAAKELGQDAADALSENPPPISLAGWFPERPIANKGDVWFEVIHYPAGIPPGGMTTSTSKAIPEWTRSPAGTPPGRFIGNPYPGKRFSTQKEAETALWDLYEEGEITDQDRHLFGVEQCTQGATQTHVGRVRVA